jgi:hypothetical protein
MGVLIFRGLTARRLYKSFGVKESKSARENAVQGSAFSGQRAFRTNAVNYETAIVRLFDTLRCLTVTCTFITKSIRI